MTPRERIKQLAGYILDWQASGVEPRGAVDDAVDALKEESAISDIHGDDRAEQLTRELAALKVNYEEALTFRHAAIALGRERDEAKAARAAVCGPYRAGKDDELREAIAAYDAARGGK